MAVYASGSSFATAHLDAAREKQRGRAGNGDPCARFEFRGEDADQSEPGGLIGDFGVTCRKRNGEFDRGNQFARFERCLKHAAKELVRRNLALVRYDRCAEREHGRRIIGGRIIVGERPPDSTAITDGWIADTAGELREVRVSISQPFAKWQRRNAASWRRW